MKTYYIYGHISLDASYNEECVRQNCRENNTHILFKVCKSVVFQVAIQNLKIKIYRTIILPVVLYGCETWSLTVREERRLRVFENRVLRKVFYLRVTR